MIIEIQHTADCPNADPIINRVHEVASTRPGVTVSIMLVEEGRPVPDGFAGSPTVLIDGTNPFGGAPTEAPACALLPPTPDQVQAAISAALPPDTGTAMFSDGPCKPMGPSQPRC